MALIGWRRSRLRQALALGWKALSLGWNECGASGWVHMDPMLACDGDSPPVAVDVSAAVAVSHP